MAPRNEVKERILRAAADLFMERGFAGTTVREIGEMADVGQSSLYHHAHSKGQLLSELHRNFSGELFDLLTEVGSSDASPTVQLRELIRALMSVVDTHRPVVTVYLRESYALSEDAHEEVEQERTKIVAIVDTILRKGRETGEFRADLDIRLTRLAILGMCNWSYQWYNPNGPHTIDQISKEFADLVVLGVLDRTPTRPKTSKPNRSAKLVKQNAS